VSASRADGLDDFAWIQDWYHRHCDGEWEHAYGLEIGTLDNPGWKIEFDLRGTRAEGRVLERVGVDDGDDDRSFAKSDGAKRHGVGDPTKLPQLLRSSCMRFEAVGPVLIEPNLG
jgi:hypothetical protein